MSFLQIKNLNKRYTTNGALVVNNLNLEIEKGEFIVFLGPSGCGKTTTIRMIAGLEDITSGEIIINEKNIAKLPVKDRGVSMIFQSYAVWPHMTVFDNIAYPLKLRKIPKNEIIERVEKAAAKASITEYLKRYPTQLSGGQRQRVAVARAIVVEPQIFLLDEPLSNLDAMLRVSMRTELKKIHEQLGATSIFVTHDQSEAMSLADRIVIIKDGIIQQLGTPYEVYNDCKTKFVASFIGTPPTNFFDVTVEKKDVAYVLKGEKVNYKTSFSFSALETYVGKTVCLGIRPESIAITDTQTEATFLECNAEFVEPQGSHNIVIVNEGENVIKIIDPECKIQAKSKIYLSTSDDKIMLFNNDSGERIR